MSRKRKVVIALVCAAVIVFGIVVGHFVRTKMIESKFDSSIGKGVEVQAKAMNFHDDNTNVDSGLSLSELAELQQEAMQRGVNKQAAGTLYIPALDLSLPIFRGANQYTLSLGVATFYYEDAEMGKGNFILAGHNMERPGVMLSDLTKLVNGDALDLVGVNKTYRYRVTNKFIAPENYEEINGLPVEGSFLSLPKKGEQPKLTLFTCVYVKDDNDRYVKERLVVQSDLE